MFTLIHGADVISSRRALTKTKSDHDPATVTTLDGPANPDELARVGGAAAMLGDRRLVIVEITGRWSKSLGAELLAKLATFPPTTDLVIWYENSLPPQDPLLVKAKAGGRVLFFKGAKSGQDFFNFLDALAAKNKKSAYLGLHRLLNAGFNPVYILSRIVGTFRNLLGVSWKVSELTPTHPFARRKVTQQARNFSEEELLRIFPKLLEVETAIKTGDGTPEVILDLLVEGICDCTSEL